MTGSLCYAIHAERVFPLASSTPFALQFLKHTMNCSPFSSTFLHTYQHHYTILCIQSRCNASTGDGFGNPKSSHDSPSLRRPGFPALKHSQSNCEEKEKPKRFDPLTSSNPLRGLAKPSTHGDGEIASPHINKLWLSSRLFPLPETETENTPSAPFEDSEREPDNEGSSSEESQSTLTQEVREEGKLFVGNLPVWIKKKEIAEFFRQFGPVKNVILIKSHDDPERNLGYCFVIYGGPTADNSAVKAVEFDGVEFHGRVLTVKLDDGRRLRAISEQRGKWVKGANGREFRSEWHKERENASLEFKRILETRRDNWQAVLNAFRKIKKDKPQHKLIFSLPLSRPVWAFEGLTGRPFRKKTGLLVPARYSARSDSIDGPIEDPPYYTYIDPHSGEPTPTFGSRSSIPSKEFWSEDTAIRVRSAQAGLPSDKSISTSKSSHGKNPGSRRKRFKERTKASESSVGKTVDHESTSKDLNYLSEEELEDTSTEPVIQQPEASEVEIDEEELARKYGEPHPFIRPNSEKKALKGQLANEELWWNWQKSPDGKEQWSAWHKPRGDVDTVMAAAMAETGQIKLFGEKPTIAEAALARARKHVFYEERLQAEEDRKAEIGPMAYYQEWVKAWKKDTSKEAVQKHFEETGEDVSVQLLNMFQHQTDREYRIMMGTDIRIRRDPLTMRMRPELKKAVYGGDPVYPTINYVQDPDHVVDYRGANFHEPVPDILEVLRQRGRLISRDDLAKKLAREKAEALEINELDDAMAGAVDIGENDEDDEDEDDEDEIPDWRTAGSSVSSLSSGEAGSKSKGSQKASAISDSEKAILKDFSDYSLFDDSED